MTRWIYFARIEKEHRAYIIGMTKKHSAIYLFIIRIVAIIYSRYKQ
jgi:hypothetical protein